MPTDVWLQWDDGLASPVSTRVERSPDDNQNFSEVANVAPPAQNHKDAALADGTYFYRTRHEITPGVFSGYSNEDSITVGSAPGPAVLVEDTFTDIDGTLIQDHTPDIDELGGGWTVSRSYTPHTTIDNNQYLGASRERSKYYIDLSTADFVASLDIISFVAGNSWVGINLRNTSGTNTASWECLYQRNNEEFVIREDGATRAFGAVISSDPLGGFDIVVTANGSTISIDSTELAAPVTYGGATQNQTTANAGVYNDRGGNRLDNFKVTELP